MKIAGHAIRLLLSCVFLVTIADVAVAQTPSAARLLVLLRNASALAIVDPASGKVLGRVPVVAVPAMKELLRVDPGAFSAPHDVLFAGGKLYFTAEGFKTIGRYDPAANKIEWMLGIGQDGSHMMALASDQQTMWVPNRGSNS